MLPRILRVLRPCLAALAFAGAVWAAAPAEAATTIQLSPPQGSPGSAFAITLSGLNKRELPYEATFDSTKLDISAPSTGSGGSVWSVIVTVPAGTASGAHDVVVRTRRPSGSSATYAAIFTVPVPAPTTTTTTTTTTAAPPPPAVVPTTTVPVPATGIVTTTQPVTTSAGAAPTATAPTTTVGAAPAVTSNETTTTTTPVAGVVPPSGVSADPTSPTSPPPADGSPTTLVEAMAVGDIGAIRPWGWIILGSVAIAAVGAAVLLYALGLFRRRDDEDHTAVGTAVDLAPVGGLASLADSRGGTWTMRYLDIEQGARLQSVHRTATGWLAVGSVTFPGSPAQARVWTSSDGFGWRGEGPWDTGIATDATVLATPLVVGHAVGGDGRPVGTVWSEGPDGRWKRITSREAPELVGVGFQHIVSMGDRLYATARDPNGLSLYTSVNGAMWGRIDLPGSVSAAHRVGERILIFGRRSDEHRVMVMQTLDGETWTEMAADQRYPFEMAAVEDVAAFESGFVAVGQDRLHSTAAVWVSDDGTRWHRVPHEFEVGTSLERVIATDRGLIGLGVRSGGGTAVWVSIDSVDWSPVHDDLMDNAIPVSLAEVDGEVRVTGGKTEAGAVLPTQVVWLGSLDDVFGAEPVAEVTGSDTMSVG